MYSLNELRRGNYVNIDGNPFVVIDNEFVKPGKGTPFNRVKIKNLLTQNTIEKTFKASEKLERADIEEKEMQYLYNDGNHYHFMHPETFEQIEVSEEALGDTVKYLLEQTMCSILFYNGKAISVSLPNFVILEITYTEPGLKGDTSNMPFKTAQLETGHEIQVPLFCEIGDKIRIDTRDNKYIERAN
ncbi:MAG: elongation factor P [Calditrichaeota bacterium]|nr:elongation factor P [Calditrichota bacterium]